MNDMLKTTESNWVEGTDTRMIELPVDSKGRYVIEQADMHRFVLGDDVKFFKPNESASRSTNCACSGREFDMKFRLGGTGLWDLVYHATEDVREDTLTKLRQKNKTPDALDRRNLGVLDRWAKDGEVEVAFAAVCRGNLAKGLGLGGVEPDAEKLAAVAQQLSQDELTALVAKLTAMVR